MTVIEKLNAINIPDIDQLFESGSIYLNGARLDDLDQTLSPGDILSWRGVNLRIHINQWPHNRKSEERRGMFSC